MTASVASSAGAELANSNSPSVTFPGGYVPQSGDVIAIFVSSTTVIGVVADASLPSGWFNPLGSGVAENASTSCGIAALYHVVTSAEAAAVTRTYTATAALDAMEIGYVHGVAVRSSLRSAPIDGSGVSSSASAVTPHSLAGITGSGVLAGGSLVVSSIAKDDVGDYGATAPAGWTRLLNTDTNQGRWTGTRDSFTVADANVDATNITPSASDQYASITLAFSAQPSRSHTYRNLQLLAG